MKKLSATTDAALPQIGQKAPSFDAAATSGSLHFPDMFAGNWVVLFSHTRAFTPVSSSDIVRIHDVGDEFLKNGCALVDLYGGDYEQYLSDFRCLKNQALVAGMESGDINFVLVDDGPRVAALNYGIGCKGDAFHEEVSSFFVIDPSSVIRTILLYHPENVNRAFEDLLRIVIALRKHDELHGGNLFRGEGSGMSIVPFHVHNRVALAF